MRREERDEMSGDIAHRVEIEEPCQLLIGAILEKLTKGGSARLVVHRPNMPMLPSARKCRVCSSIEDYSPTM